jgi:DNA topoisomerase-1
VVIGEGKYGPYVRFAGEFTSLGKTLDPYTITLEEAIEVLEQKKQTEEPILVFGDVQVLNGRYGAYIKAPQGNYKIPRSVDLQSLTQEKCQEIIALSQPSGKAKKGFSKNKK